ncbi:GDSL-type esterase/lipase family protein [Sphingomonas sp. RS6]
MKFGRRSVLAGAVGLPALVPLARAQESWEQRKERLLHEDWPELSRYAEDDRRLIRSGAKIDIVFMGDSITEGWQSKRPGFFKEGRVCRGISGQTTPQMVLRMMADVIHLKPRFVHIMAGTNDVAGNTGTITRDQTLDNVRMMTTLAQANDIGVLLAAVPPADHFPWRPGLETIAPIRAINAGLQEHAKAIGAVWIDYATVLGNGAGGIKAGLASDGVHPTEAGYDAMATVIEPILAARHA